MSQYSTFPSHKTVAVVTDLWGFKSQGNQTRWKAFCQHLHPLIPCLVPLEQHSPPLLHFEESTTLSGNHPMNESGSRNRLKQWTALQYPSQCRLSKMWQGGSWQSPWLNWMELYQRYSREQTSNRLTTEWTCVLYPLSIPSWIFEVTRHRRITCG